MSEQRAADLLTRSSQWLAARQPQGWLASDSFDAEAAANLPHEIFSGPDRPLVIGLFGGTGVGKSSLLNRLAGADVARTGVVRPTSMEITAYFHENVDINALPNDFPVDRFAMATHKRDELADIVWVDMPDFDSEETQNREQVLHWLGHIDLLIYVVTPERYRDAEGWRLLLGEGYRHAWLFVFNQWDRAQPLQLDDFQELLQSAGFSAPGIFRTICDGTASPDDDFDQLFSTVTALAERKLVAQLHQTGLLHRLHEVDATLASVVNTLQTEGSESALQVWQRQWRQFRTEALDNIRVPLRDFASQFLVKKTGVAALLSTAVGSAEAEQLTARGVAARTDAGRLWDDWSSVRLADVIDQFRVAQTEHNVPVARLDQLFDGTAVVSESLNTDIAQGLRQAVDSSLVQPGATWQRVSLIVLDKLKLFLPVFVIGWTSWRVLGGFVAGAADASEYVGVGLLVNGAMLTVFAWGVPWLLSRLLRPSLPRSVERGLHDELTHELDRINNEVVGRLESLGTERQQLQREANNLRADVNSVIKRAEVLNNPALERFLLPHPDMAGLIR